MLYRLSISQHREQFLLKGALLFDLWFDVPHRPTHDVDFLGFGAADIPRLEEVFRDICRIESPDGMVFQPDSVKGAEIRKEANYAGIRLTLMGVLDSARCPIPVSYTHLGCTVAQYTAHSAINAARLANCEPR